MKHVGVAAAIMLVALSVTAMLASCSKTRPTEQPAVTGGPVGPKTTSVEKPKPGASAKARAAKEETPETSAEKAEEQPQAGNVEPAGTSEAEKKAETTAEGEEVTLTDANFDDIIGKQGTVALVDFWAPWCGPCRQQAPIIEELAKEYAGKVIVGKVNTDENEKLPERFGIKAIPTLIVFKDGEEVDRSVGLTPKEKLEAMIDKVLGE